MPDPSTALEKWGFHADDPAPPEAGFFGMEVPPEEAAVVVEVVPFEATTSYGQGAASGPEAIRVASHQMDFFDRRFGRPYELGIATIRDDWADRVRRLDAEAGQLVGRAREEEASAAERARIDEIGATVAAELEARVGRWMDAGKLVAVVGGDHSTALGAIAAAAARHPQMGILHFDAHLDLRVAYEGFRYSHASVMHNALERCAIGRLTSVGIRDFSEAEMRAAEAGPVEVLYDEDLRELRLRGRDLQGMMEEVVARLPEAIYLSFDIDGLDPSLCPHTGTPVPGGLPFDEAMLWMKVVAQSGRRVVGLDLTEVAPGPDEWDANVGARVLYRMIGAALRSRGQL